MTAIEHAGAVALAACLLPAASAAVAPAAAQDPGLRIVVLDGDDNINIIEGGAAVPTRVEVRDRDGRPVSGATVLFLLGAGATATLNAGQRQVTLTTNAQGQAAVAVVPVASGGVELSVSAAFGGETATLTVVQSNYATVEEAVAAGVGAPGAPGTATGTGGEAAAGGGAGGGLGTGAIAGIAAAAGGAVGVGLALGGGEDPAPVPPSPPPTPESLDRAVLMELYDATNGPTWADNTNWGSSAPLDRWFGVSTDEERRVVSLRLGANRLSGSIPPSFGRLANLQYVDLGTNDLAGSIPSSLGSLTRLTHLLLAENGFTGSIPSSLSGLANLTSLDIGVNALSGSIPAFLDGLANLTELWLHENEFTGSIPFRLGNLSRLNTLSLSRNALSGPIPSTLGDLANLQHLSLHHNDLTGSIPSRLGDLANLQHLYLQMNRLSGSIPAGLCEFEGFINPQQGNVNLPGCSAEAMGDRAVLIELYDATDGPSWTDSTNWVGGAPLDEWYGVTTDAFGRVTALGLTANGLAGSIPASLSDLTELRLLELGSNALSGSIPPSLGGLANLGGLQLHENRLTGSLPPSLGDLANLGHLLLNHNRLTGPIPTALGGLSKLTYLDLGYNALSGSIPPSLGSLANVEWFSLAGNELRGSIPVSLGNPAKLRYFYLSGNRLSGSIPSSLGDLVTLRDLYLNENQLSGPIPASLGNLTDLVSLYLFENQLSGSIPPALSNLTKLDALLLEDNQLSGEIPPSLGDLEDTRLIDLRLNRLTGSIPAALCKFGWDVNPQRDGVILPGCDGSVNAGALEARLVPGDGRLRVDWTAPPEEVAVDDYDVRYRIDTESGVWTELPDAAKSTATSATITGLTNGAVYRVQVRAGTAAGDGAWSATVTGAPAAPAERLSFGEARIEDQRYRQYAAMAPLELPAATGGVGAVTYTLSPALPAGLAFDAASRTIGGAPTATSAVATYTYTATDSAASPGRASLSFTLEVEVSAEEAALRRDVLAAQGRALLSSATGVIGERFRRRPGSAAAGRSGAWGAGALVNALASMLGAGMGGGPGVAAGGGRFAQGLRAGDHSGLGALGPGGRHAGGRPALGRGGPGGLPALAGRRHSGAFGFGGLPAPGGRRHSGAFGFGGLPAPAGGRPALGRGGPGGLPAPGGRRHSGAFGFGPGGWDGLVWGRSFAAPVGNAGADGGPSRYTVWGAGDRQSFGGSPAAGRYGGDLRSLYVGADGRLGADWLAGAAMSRSWGSADYTAAVAGASAGRLTTRLTSVYPYVRGTVSRGLELWAVGGYGRGEAADAPGAEAAGEPGRLTMRMGAAGLRREMLRRSGVALSLVGGAGSLALSTSGGGPTVAGLGAGVHRGRLAVEAARAAGAVSPFVQIGGRYDGGDGQTGTGLELVGGLRAAAPRAELEARGRWLSAHSAAGYEEYGVSVRLALKSRPDGTGPRALLSPRWGMADALSPGEDGLLGGGGMAGLPRGATGLGPAGQALSMDGEVGYGWRARRLRGVLSPLTSYRRTGFGGDLTQVGLSYQSMRELLQGDVRMQFTLGREQWPERGAGYQAAVTLLSVF